MAVKLLVWFNENEQGTELATALGKKIIIMSLESWRKLIFKKLTHRRLHGNSEFISSGQPSQK